MIAFRQKTMWLVFAAALSISVSWAGHGRADSPPGRYTIANGTVYDTKTLLTWQQINSDKTYTWAEAGQYCATLNLEGTGWRMPSVKELQTIVDDTRYVPPPDVAPAVDACAFPYTPLASFWTSSPSAEITDYAWVVYFANGATQTDAMVFTSKYVRGGR